MARKTEYFVYLFVLKQIRDSCNDFFRQIVDENAKFLFKIFVKTLLDLETILNFLVCIQNKLRTNKTQKMKKIRETGRKIFK